MAEAAEVLEAVTVRPGDTLLVRVAQSSSSEQLTEMAGQLRERLNVEVLVIACEQIACVRGGKLGSEVDGAVRPG